MRTVLALTMVSLLAACAAAGVKIDPGQAAAFERGKATYGEVVAKFGPPTSQTVTGDGARFIAYSYVRSAARPESFIPIVGPFVGGADSQSQMVMFRFGPDGRLVDTTQSSSQIGVGTGPFSGAGVTPRSGQPSAPP